MKNLIVYLLYLIFSAACVVVPPLPPAPPPGPTPVPSADFFFAVTITDPYNGELVADSLKAHHEDVTARIVFDEFVKASEYVEAVPIIARGGTHLMGELLDSQYVSKYSIKQYEDRALEYYNAFKTDVSIWEVGNEINGEWLGNSDAVVAKITLAHRVIKSRGGVTALTLYYNPNCYEKKENEMIPWVKKYLTSEIKDYTDYILVSYYPYDCNNYFPNSVEWENVFKQLAELFPNSSLGIGECGSPRIGRHPDLPSIKAYGDYYYSIRPNVKNFIGGYFWWDYSEDMISKIGERNLPWQYLESKMVR